jgi:chemotaxis protein methyltransferase CheR
LAPQMTDQELAAFRKGVYDLTGIQLDDSKKYLLETRLQDLLEKLGCTTFGQIL